MAADIVPIELSLPAGDLVTLWAPPWREDGEEWQAFLGDDEALFAFGEVAGMVGFTRTASEHDLTDHPAWSAVPQLPAADLVPEQAQRYDLVGVPDLVAERLDTWVLTELAEVVAVVRALADVCELDKVREILGSTPGFAMLDGGPVAFAGREGRKAWEGVRSVVAERWDVVLDAIDAAVRTPPVEDAARDAAAAELDEARPEPEERATEDDATAPALAFWSEVGIDPIRIVSSRGEHYTLRCYLDDEPVFLGRSGRIEVFGSPRALVRHVAERTDDHDLARVSTWPEVVARANAGELEAPVDEANSYALVGLADDLAEGPEAVDAVQLDLAVELLTDADAWAGDNQVPAALAGSEPLGWLVSFVLRPEPTRLAPSPPFDAEVAAWQRLVNEFEDRLTVH